MSGDAPLSLLSPLSALSVSGSTPSSAAGDPATPTPGAAAARATSRERYIGDGSGDIVVTPTPRHMARDVITRTDTLPYQTQHQHAVSAVLLTPPRSSSLDGASVSKPPTPTHSDSVAVGSSLSVLSSSKVAAIKEKLVGAKSRTLPSRRNSKKNYTVATRLKAYMSQQKVDGVYCVVAAVPAEPESAPAPVSPVPKSPAPAPAAADSDASDSDSSSSSSDDSSSSSDSSSSDSDDSSSSESESASDALQTTVPLASLMDQQKQAKRKRRKRRAEKKKAAASAKSAAELKRKVLEPVIFVINRHGGIFGKNPSLGQSGIDLDRVPSLTDDTDPASSSSSSSSRPAAPPKQCIISDPYTSKRHFQVVGDTKGRFYVTDLGSLNGTFVRRNFDPMLAMSTNASSVYGAAAAAALMHHREGTLSAAAGRGMSPVLCSSPTHQGRAHAASVNSPVVQPVSHSSGREGWGSGCWAPGAATPASAAASATPTVGGSLGLHQSLLVREGSSGSGDCSTSASGSVSVTQSGYASVGTQWLNSQSHAPNSGYRLTRNSVFLLGKSELMVVRIHDIDNPLEATPDASGASPLSDGDDAAAASTPSLQSYHVIFSYSFKPVQADGSVATTPVVRTKQIGILGGRIGRAADNDLCLPVSTDGGVDDYQSEVIFENGKFYLRDLHWSMDRGLWSRLASKAEEGGATAACQLYNGDRIKVGMTEFTVSIRCIPPPLSITSQGSAYEIGTALEPNLNIQKEMQDRLVAIGNYGGHALQAFFGIYDGHQERTVADFAAAAFHHNLLEEIHQLRRNGESEFEFLHSFRKPPSSVPSIANSSIHSPNIGSVGANSPATYAAAAASTLSTHTRSRSGSEARGLFAQFGRPSLGASPPPPSSGAPISPTTPLRGFLPRGSPQPPVDDDLSLQALSELPAEHTLQIFPPTSPRHSSHSSLSIDCGATQSTAPTGGTPGAHALSPSSRLTPLLGPAPAAGHRKNSSSTFFTSGLHAHISRLLEADMVSCIRGAYTRTAAQIKGMGDAASYGGSTAVSVLLWHHPLSQETRLYASNIGDSRALLIREGGRPELLSHLHIGRDESEQARVRAAGGRIMQNGRLAGCLEVTRAFGDHGMISFGLVADPFITDTVLQPTDTHLVVSSDGLFDVMTYDEIARMLRQAPAEMAAQQLAFALVEAAMKRKSRDNMSVIVVKLRPQAERSTIVTAVDAASSGSFASNAAGSVTSAGGSVSATAKDMLAATSALVDQFIAQPLSRVPSLASIYAKPQATSATAAATRGFGLAVGVSHSNSAASMSLEGGSPSSSLSASPDAAGSMSPSSPVRSRPRVHSATTSPVSPTQPPPPSDFSTLEQSGRASSVPNPSHLPPHLQSSVASPPHPPIHSSVAFTSPPPSATSPAAFASSPPHGGIFSFSPLAHNAALDGDDNDDHHQHTTRTLHTLEEEGRQRQ